jgi:phenol 2-monooxygenase
MAQEFDVLICGSGSAGLAAATWLARTGIRCKILERRDGPMQIGQADGVQCRTVEVFESFGISEELLRAGYHVLEVTFWSSDACGNLVRTSRTADSIPGLSHQPHLILNQASINGFLLDAMRKFNRQEVSYGYTVDDIRIDNPSPAEKDAYPVHVAATKDGRQEIFSAKYVLVSIPELNGVISYRTTGL